MVGAFGAKLREVLNRLMEAQWAYAANPHDQLLRFDLRLWCCAAVVGALRELNSNRQSNGECNCLVAAAEEYLKQHLGDPVHMPDLVRHIGLGHTRLWDLFTKATGLTPHNYLLRLRILKAKELLAKPGVPMTEIAMECGFSSSQRFSSVFHRHVGQAPREYRREAFR